MGKTIAQKIIASHLVAGDMMVGSEVALRIDQTLTQDATGTMAYLEFETMGIERVKTEFSPEDPAFSPDLHEGSQPYHQNQGRTPGNLRRTDGRGCSQSNGTDNPAH